MNYKKCDAGCNHVKKNISTLHWTMQNWNKIPQWYVSNGTDQRPWPHTKRQLCDLLWTKNVLKKNINIKFGCKWITPMKNDYQYNVKDRINSTDFMDALCDCIKLIGGSRLKK